MRSNLTGGARKQHGKQVLKDQLDPEKIKLIINTAEKRFGKSAMRNTKLIANAINGYKWKM